MRLNPHNWINFTNIHFLVFEHLVQNCTSFRGSVKRLQSLNAKFFVRVERMWDEGGNGSSLYFSFFKKKKITLKFSLTLWSQVILCGHIFEFCVFKINKSCHFILKFACLTSAPSFDISNGLTKTKQWPEGNWQCIVLMVSSSPSLDLFGDIINALMHLSQAESRAVNKWITLTYKTNT